MAASRRRVVSMSRTCGIFSRMTGSSVSKEAAMAGRAAFLAPLMRMVPRSGLPPRMTNLSIRYLRYVSPRPIGGENLFYLEGKKNDGERLLIGRARPVEGDPSQRARPVNTEGAGEHRGIEEPPV